MKEPALPGNDTYGSPGKGMPRYATFEDQQKTIQYYNGAEEEKALIQNDIIFNWRNHEGQVEHPFYGTVIKPSMAAPKPPLLAPGLFSQSNVHGTKNIF